MTLFNTYGIEYLGTNENGTEKFKTHDGLIIKSYLTGYVRRESTHTYWNSTKTVTTCWQVNLTKIENGNTVRIILPTHKERYQRIADWNNNRIWQYDRL